MLPIFYNTKDALEKAIPGLQSCIRAQKQRKFNKLRGDKDYTLICSNSLGMSWENAVENIHEVAFLQNNSTTTSTVKFLPLNFEQILSFPNFKNKCHHHGLMCLPGNLIAAEYGISTKTQLQDAVDELLEFFPLLCVKKSGHFILLDYTEMVFNLGLVGEVLTIDQKYSEISEEENHCNHNKQAKENEGIFFNTKPGPTSIQQKYPQLLTIMMDFIKLHDFSAHFRCRSSSTSFCGVTIQDIRQHLLESVEGLNAISK